VALCERCGEEIAVANDLVAGALRLPVEGG
jgi:hypothetical protein